ncbi:OmpA family protein [Flavivirga sp. 57AJ16]|uniref:OmpA family protein n=1 Tax=Flavivirga sp. 57AJ16 TaxID=3025307 RepID=UPI0023672CB9|nr:OmpA family protein [Flavivirga sp. 57AJ16]MDD7887403.1 OmpA family protein [Flavivirga sp. 57AJ16]
MNRTYLICLLTIMPFISCKNDKKTDYNDQSEEAVEKEISKSTDNTQTKDLENNNKKAFSWDNIPESTADIGAYPYITPPKGMTEDDDNSKSYEFDKLEMFDGNTFFIIEGKVRRMSIIMEGDKEWQQYLFDKSVSDYLKSIGAKLIFDGQIPNELTGKWGDDPNTVYKHMHEFYAGDVVNHPVSLYVLKTANKKIGFQVSSNSRTIGIVEKEDFTQTIEKVTADDILDEINNKGYATLHINFDTGKSRIKADSYDVIDEIAKMMKANTDLKISIEGHTDNVGDEISNMKLSKNRARSVLMALIDEDIDESRLKSEGFGQTNPIENNSTEEGRAKNRRVELRKI